MSAYIVFPQPESEFYNSNASDVQVSGTPHPAAEAYVRRRIYAGSLVTSAPQEPARPPWAGKRPWWQR